MVGSKTEHHVELSGLKCQLRKISFLWIFRIAQEKEAAARLRRLKELAEQDKHHEAALRFHADEMRAKRWHETGKLASCLDMLFDWVSNYGQSILRPTFCLALLAVVSPFMQDVLRYAWDVLNLPIQKETVRSMLQNSLPFLPASRPNGSVTAIPHQLLAVIFIFLIGLGLRNRFRI